MELQGGADALAGERSSAPENLWEMAEAAAVVGGRGGVGCLVNLAARAAHLLVCSPADD